MFCSQCGREYEQKVNFCCHCGNAMFTSAKKPKGRLALSRKDKQIAGVCGGFAEYMELDPAIVRIIWLVTAIFTGVGFIAYLIAWIAMPQAPEVEPARATAPAEEPRPVVNS